MKSFLLVVFGAVVFTLLVVGLLLWQSVGARDYATEVLSVTERTGRAGACLEVAPQARVPWGVQDCRVGTGDGGYLVTVKLPFARVLTLNSSAPGAP